jgi:Rrf2 family protein
VWQLALHPERTATISELAAATDVPRSFLAKILQGLVSANIVLSYRGAKGGFRLARPPEETSLYAVYREMEGPRAAESQCAISQETCGVHQYCTLHPFWHGARERFEELLREAIPGVRPKISALADQEPIKD